MGRTWGQSFQTEAIADLTRQLGFAPAAQRVKQVQAAERLHDELAAETTYPFSFLVYRVTGTRPTADREEVFLVGKSAAHDLRLLIDRLSRTVSLAEPAGGVVTPGELAEELGASVKTITRWRSAGLRWRWMLEPGGARHRVVICRSAVEAFRRRDGAGRIERAATFSRTDEATVGRMLDEARRLAGKKGATLNRVARHVAERHGRGLETVRQIIQRHDRERPELAIFPDRRGPLTDRQRRVIERAYRRGIEAPRLAERFGRSTSTVYRVISETRSARLRGLSIEWVDISVFDRADAEAVILRERFKDVDWTSGRPVDEPEASGTPAWLVRAATRATLSTERCRSLLVRYNYLKRRAAEQRDGLSAREPSAKRMDRIEGWLNEAEAVRRLVFASHLPRLLAVARRQWDSSPSARRRGMAAWVAMGADVLEASIESYNPSRTQPFDGYLVNRLLQAYARQSGPRRGDAGVEAVLRRRLSAMGLVEPEDEPVSPTTAEPGPAGDR